MCSRTFGARLSSECMQWQRGGDRCSTFVQTCVAVVLALCSVSVEYLRSESTLQSLLLVMTGTSLTRIMDALVKLERVNAQASDRTPAQHKKENYNVLTSPLRVAFI